MTALADFLREEIEAGSFPGGSALVGSETAVIGEAFAGHAAVDPANEPLAEATRFDFASLTKPLACGALVRVAVGRGLSLTDRPGRYLPEWNRTRYDGITLETLLTHTSGLPAWYPLYVRGEGPAAYRRTLAEIDPECAPGAAVIYSDLGILVVGEVLERIYSAPLERCFTELVADPAKSGARFHPEDPLLCAATERADRFERERTAALGLSYAGFRDEVVRGDVHDGNAFRRGGVAAHAGLFGTARDAWNLCRAWLDPAAADFTEDRTPGLSEGRGVAWQSRRGANSAVPELSESSFGHTGFPGTSVWIDPGRRAIFILLTNRIHPEVRPVDFNEVRRRFHRAALRLL